MKKIKNIKPLVIIDPQKREIDSVIKQLYKIKTINRKKQYRFVELEELVMKSSKGNEVLNKLNQMNISSEELEQKGFYLAALIFGPYLKK